MLIEIPDELVTRCRQRLQDKPSDSKSLLNTLCHTVAYGQITTTPPDDNIWDIMLICFLIGVFVGLALGMWVY